MKRVRMGLLGCLTWLSIGATHASEAVTLQAMGEQVQKIRRLNASPACAPVADVLALMQLIDGLDAGWLRRGLRSLAMGWLPSNAEVANSSRQAIRDGVLSSFSCHLALRATALLDPANARNITRSTLVTRLDDMRQLARGWQRLRRLQEVGSEDAATLYGRWDALAQDAYGKAWPEGKLHSPWLLRLAESPALPVKPAQAAGFEEKFVAEFRQQALLVRDELVREPARRVDSLRAYLAGNLPDEAALQALDLWLRQVQGSWLPSSVLLNPCEDLRKLLAPGIDDLINVYGFPSTLATVSREFEAEACYRPLMRQLQQADFPPWGPLVAPGDPSQVNPAIRRRIQEINGKGR
ncbi:MAG: hypothetical protein L6Q40_01335 [Azonexus sp.]|nr:hypothetical protein [Azonexus sp.]